MNKSEIDKLILLLSKLDDLDFVIVEGVNDKKAIKNFSSVRILTTKTTAIFNVVEQIPKKSRVAILTDLDSEGKKLYSQLNSVLSQRGVIIDNRLRYFLFKNTELRQIEGLINFLDSHSP
ncbi:hypothetical protein HY483_01205 [Candidatus Woesearchaeota archaeon]|nr:hypothetical protein [Candidatus Woesearchaeota archaeon]